MMAKINIQLICRANRKQLKRIYSALLSTERLPVLWHDRKSILIIESGFQECYDTDKMMSDFVEKCKDFQGVFRECARSGQVDWSLLTIIMSDDETIHPGAHLSPEMIRLLSDLNADAGFAYYTMGEF